MHYGKEGPATDVTRVRAVISTRCFAQTKSTKAACVVAALIVAASSLIAAAANLLSRRRRA